jgi:HK97 family phage prohead protease
MPKQNIEVKQIGGLIQEVKQEQRNGVPVGLIAGYIATWDLDRGDDRFVKGAFAESIIAHKKKNRPIRFKDNHGRTVGGFPVDGVFEDDKGLFGTAEVNLEVQQGRELFSLVKQKVISDFSIGFSTQEFEINNGTRIIEKAIIWEGSAVDEPMNSEANIVSFKAATPFRDLSLADRDRPWDANSALSRVKQLTDSEEKPGKDYKDGFFWFDRADKENFGAYKLPFADVIDGKLVAIPRGIFAAAAAMQGARGGVDIPDAERAAVERHINRYYNKMDLESPFEKSGLGVTELETMTKKDVEEYLRNSGLFSRKASKYITSQFIEYQCDADKGGQCDAGKGLMEELKKLTETLKK